MVFSDRDQQEPVVTLRRLSFWDRVLIALIPSRRRRYERNLRAGIRYLIKNPEAPLYIRE